MHPWSTVTRTVELVLATPLLAVAMIQSPRRWGLVVLALLLAGVITVDNVAHWLHRPSPETDEGRSITAMTNTPPIEPELDPDEEELEPDEEETEPDTPAR